MVSFDAPNAVRSGGTGAPQALGLDELTSAERAVVDLVLRGFSNRAIAVMRRVSRGTIANQLTSAYGKLGVGCRRELVAAAPASTRPLDRAPAGVLTFRQRQVLALADDGCANKVIADALSISISTVSTMLTRARRKLAGAALGAPHQCRINAARAS